MRLKSCLVLGLFFIWILPLGAFINPANEKLACDGQRAICLCRHNLIKLQDHGEGKRLIKTAPTTERDNSHGTSSHNFLVADLRNSLDPQLTSHVEKSSVFYSLLSISAVEPVPKV